jgi:hypothetical protein
MTRFTDTVMIKGEPVEVVIDVPAGQSVLNLQELAEAAHRSVNKEITVKGVTVRIVRR